MNNLLFSQSLGFNKANKTGFFSALYLNTHQRFEIEIFYD